MSTVNVTPDLVVKSLQSCRTGMQRVCTFRHQVWLVEQGHSPSDYITYNEAQNSVDVKDSSMSKILCLGDADFLTNDLMGIILNETKDPSEDPAKWCDRVRASPEWKAYKAYAERLVKSVQDVLTPMHQVLAMVDPDSAKGEKPMVFKPKSSSKKRKTPAKPKPAACTPDDSLSQELDRELQHSPEKRRRTDGSVGPESNEELGPE